MAPTICNEEDLHLRNRIGDTRKRFDSNAMRTNQTSDSVTSDLNVKDNQIMNTEEQYQSNARRFNLFNSNATDNLRQNQNIKINDDLSDISNNDLYQDDATLDSINSDNSRLNLIENDIDISRDTINNGIQSNYIEFLNDNNSIESTQTSSSSNNQFCDHVRPFANNATSKNSTLKSSSFCSSSSISFLSSPTTSSEHNENSYQSSCDSIKLNNKSIYRRNHPYRKNHHNHYQQNQYDNYYQQQNGNKYLNNKKSIINREEKNFSFFNNYNNTSVSVTPPLSPPLSSSPPYSSTSILEDEDFHINELKIRTILQQKLNFHKKSDKCNGELLRTKGLVEIAIKTIKLIRRNQMLQMKLNQLQMETKQFVQSVMSNPENRGLCSTNEQTNEINHLFNLNNVKLENCNSNDANYDNEIIVTNNYNNNNNSYFNNNKIENYRDTKKQLTNQCIIPDNSNNNNNNTIRNQISNIQKTKMSSISEIN